MTQNKQISKQTKKSRELVQLGYSVGQCSWCSHIDDIIRKNYYFKDCLFQPSDGTLCVQRVETIILSAIRL